MRKTNTGKRPKERLLHMRDSEWIEYVKQTYVKQATEIQLYEDYIEELQNRLDDQNLIDAQKSIFREQHIAMLDRVILDDKRLIEELSMAIMELKSEITDLKEKLKVFEVVENLEIPNCIKPLDSVRYVVMKQEEDNGPSNLSCKMS